MAGIIMLSVLTLVWGVIIVILKSEPDAAAPVALFGGIFMFIAWTILALIYALGSAFS